MLCKTKKPKQTKEQSKKQQQQKQKQKNWQHFVTCLNWLALCYIRKIRNEGGNLLKYIPNAHTSCDASLGAQTEELHFFLFLQ